MSSVLYMLGEQILLLLLELPLPAAVSCRPHAHLRVQGAELPGPSVFDRLRSLTGLSRLSDLMSEKGRT